MKEALVERGLNSKKAKAQDSSGSHNWLTKAYLFILLRIMAGFSHCPSTLWQDLCQEPAGQDRVAPPAEVRRTWHKRLSGAFCISSLHCFHCPSWHTH